VETLQRREESNQQKKKKKQIKEIRIFFPRFFAFFFVTLLSERILISPLPRSQADNSAVSIFTFDTKKNQGKVAAASNAFKRAKTLRHPYILPFLDGVESDGAITLVTEAVIPLEEALQEAKEYPQSISWGLYQVSVRTKRKTAMNSFLLLTFLFAVIVVVFRFLFPSFFRKLSVSSIRTVI
jgi:hypothetical protein